jgi:uncharacterized RDD family membrane protein YckC
MQTDNPYEPPAVTEVAAPAPPDTRMELAGLGERFLGSLIDSLISLAFVLLFFFILYATGFIVSLEDIANLSNSTSLLLALVIFIFDIAINWKFLSTTGQSIGKKVAKTRIVTLDGRRPSMFVLVVKRYAFFTFIAEIPEVGSFLTLINILFIFGRERRCLHDYIAGTRVVRAHPGLTLHAAAD